MEYTKTEWKDLPDTTTPITASALNNIEDGVEYLFEHGAGDSLPVGTEIDFDGTSQDIPTGWEEITNPNSYSTSEVKTNEIWTNGKPIYRKVITINGLPNNSEAWQNTGVTNGSLCFYDTTCKLTPSDEYIQKLPYTSPFSTTGNIAFTVKSDVTDIHITTFTDRSSASATVILYYTKTTDQGGNS